MSVATLARVGKLSRFKAGVVLVAVVDRVPAVDQGDVLVPALAKSVPVRQTHSLPSDPQAAQVDLILDRAEVHPELVLCDDGLPRLSTLSGTSIHSHPGQAGNIYGSCRMVS
jgi:hypothetical protein